MSRAPALGDASLDEVEVRERARAEEVRVERVRTYETDHLCIKCTHAPVCAVVAAIRAVDAEGDLVVSSCGAFETPSPSLADLIAMAEGDVENVESDEDRLKDRR